ncbi:hypothetical protein [Methanolobus sp. WCC5]|jgi:hypothetical protein|uniref:hypothetical protein n=1 Tax=Methanolobus sp. WCC5 TaxID=3125785 RepID=UPI00324E6909
MVKIFKRTGEKKTLPEDGKAQLADASRRLGFEVGYHHHSEIGWVQEKLTQIYRFAEEYDLRDFVKEYYNYGKEEGAKVKERDTKSGLSRGLSPQEPEKPPGFTFERAKNDAYISKPGSGYKSSDISFPVSSDMILQPGLVDLPDNIERTKAIERPSFLDGARHLTPKKK